MGLLMRIIGVNGIHNLSTSKNSFTDKFLAHLAQHHEICDVQYPKMFAFLGYFDWSIKRRAKIVAAANTSPDDIVIAHSFGCLATLYAMKYYDAVFNKLIFFGAAAESDFVLPLRFNKLYNIHSRTDSALSLGAILPGHKFGTLGKYGYTGIDHRVANIDATGHEHADYVDPKNICNWHKVIEQILSGTIDEPIIAPANLIDRYRYDYGVHNHFGRK
jgi:pimeloyl-ACP methyl ester carboxylesterase